MKSLECPICKSESFYESYNARMNHFQCPKCGEFQIGHLEEARLKNYDSLHKLSSWIREQNKNNHEEAIDITLKKIEQVLKQREKTIREKFECFMQEVAKIVLNSSHIVLELNQFNHCYIYCEKELAQIIAKAYKEGFFKEPPKSKLDANLPSTGTRGFFGLTFEGQEFIESLNEPNKNSNKIFMAFWFDPTIQEMFTKTIMPAIDNAGFLAERVSSSTTALENKISDEIIGMIKSSRAVIADCTGNRTAVYYEAGYAMGMKIPVIWTCRADEVNDICFDVSQHPFILWDTPEELADKIVKRLKAIL